MKKRAVSCLAAVAFAVPGLSHAGMVVLVDSFNLPSMFVFDQSTAVGVATQTSSGPAVNPPANTVLSRTVTHELLASTNSATGTRSNVGVANDLPPGTLAIKNDTFRDAKVTIEWFLPAAFIPSALTIRPASLVFDLLFTDQDVAVDLFYGGQLFGTRTLTAYNGILGFPVLAPKATSFDLTAVQQNTISSPGQQVLKMVLNGPAAWDLRLDNVRFELLEPGSLPLVALALAGALVAQRRRKVNSPRS